MIKLKQTQVSNNVLFVVVNESEGWREKNVFGVDNNHN